MPGRASALEWAGARWVHILQRGKSMSTLLFPVLGCYFMYGNPPDAFVVVVDDDIFCLSDVKKWQTFVKSVVFPRWVWVSVLQRLAVCWDSIGSILSETYVVCTTLLYYYFFHCLRPWKELNGSLCRETWEQDGVESVKGTSMKQNWHWCKCGSL